ncbi:DUF2125 domain-containing protein [Sulfitobacter sp. LCG007]
MKSFTRFLPSTALALVILAPAARADLTGAEVWEDWKGYFEAMGYEVSGSESQTGDTLSVSDVAIVMNLPEDDSRFEMTWEKLTFTDVGDGSVKIGLPGTMPIAIDTMSRTDESWNIRLDFTQTGLDMSAAGESGDITYSYSADTVATELASVTVDGETMPEGDVAGRLAFAGLSGSTAVKVGAMREIRQTAKAEQLDYLIRLLGPEGATANASGTSQGIDLTSNLAIPLEAVDPNDPAAMLANGFAVDSAISFGANSGEFATTGPEGAIRGTTTSQGGELAVDMGSAGLAYSMVQNALQMAMTADATPLPIAFELGEFATKLLMPLTESDDPQDFALTASLVDLKVSEAIWMLFDPQGKLPRDPATAEIDLTGKMRVTSDLLDPALDVQPELGSGQAGNVDSVTLNALRLDLAGAELTGSGQVDFDNSQPMAGPVPEGSVDLKLSGGNGLLDNLVAMGILPDDQAMGARMMLGLFGVPTGEPDTLTSKIEFRKDGQILANGQRIK